MANGYKIIQPSGKVVLATAETFDERMKRVMSLIDRWQDYCDANWLNDSDEVFPPEKKVKLFLDGAAYFLMVGQTDGIETDYKKVMIGKREIPASNCPSFVENAFYASGCLSGDSGKEELTQFNSMAERLDAKAEKYEKPKQQKEKIESKFHKKMRFGIHGGTWCRVDTDNNFIYNSEYYHIDNAIQAYAPVQTEHGLLYDMDRVLVSEGRFFDMNFDEIMPNQITRLGIPTEEKTNSKMGQ